MLLARRVVRLRRGEYPPMSLATSMDGKRARCRPFRVIRGAFAESASAMTLEVDGRVQAGDWTGHDVDDAH